ncbi:MAG TPA: cation diffusion facilitator family transporter [Steroidobacteraceae bacterium]|nr:cation diffusion facilitator family transporter [Steroidobacteraceae bacterium]
MNPHSHDHHHDHGHDHDHAHGPGHVHGADQASERRLWLAFGLLFSFTLVEAGGGLWANSVALYAEAAHMLADAASLLLAIIAIRMARRPARADRTYGHRRYQTLAAYTNGLVLLALTCAVVVAASRRLLLPPQVNGTVMLVIAAIGAAANICAFMALTGATSLNERSARLHVLSDLAGSAAAVGAAGLILWRGWIIADPVLSLAVAVLILRSGWQLTRDSAHVLLEGAPSGFDAHAVEHELETLPGIKGVHHIHVWSLTGETPMLTLHATLRDGADRHAALTAVMQRLHERFGVDHATVQIEEGECAGADSEEDCLQSAHAPDARRAG